MAKIIYTHTDEAPAWATFSWYAIIEAYLKTAGISLEKWDISLAGRILANFPEKLTDDQKTKDALSELGELVKQPDANVIKLPNISASVSQLEAAIRELQACGFDIPDYPEEDGEIKQRYGKVLGSAVNPVLREGNSDRRAPNAVKEYAKKNPHSMGAWSSDSKTRVSCMSGGDFRSNEQSHTVEKAGILKIELEDANGQTTVLKESVPVQEGEVIDASFMDVAKLRAFLKEQIQAAKDEGVLFSLHMKATMMKVSDPIIFGHCISVLLDDVFTKHADALSQAGADENKGLGSVIASLENLDADKKSEILADIDAAIAAGPDLAMVDSDKGITNLHVPSDVIIDASMPAMIRTSGQMWDKDGKQQDTIAVIPESSYAGVYEETINYCKKNGAFDPTTMGTVPNVGLMAQKAEEYGSHDKTFEIPVDGTVRVKSDDATIFEHKVSKGDIWRMCQTKDAPIKNWVELAVSRARISNTPVVFWLNKDRPHDAELIKKLDQYLPGVDTDGLQIEVMSPVEATKFTVERVGKGQDTISATGNVLRDYLTDLFPILELGTSAKMLSIVPLMNGGGLFETGAGGSAPKHVQQLEKENHLRWDSLGEFLALAASLDHLSRSADNAKAKVLADTLDAATGKFLDENKSPSRKVNELDNRGSHYYMALFWAEALAAQSDDSELQAKFTPLAEKLRSNESKIVGELNAVQGKPVNLNGYFQIDPATAEEVMRPSSTLNEAISSL